MQVAAFGRLVLALALVLLWPHAAAAADPADTVQEVGGGNAAQFTYPSVTLQCGTYKYYRVKVTDPCADLTLSVAKTSGEPNIYVSNNPKNPQPTKDSMSWAAFAYGSYSVSISHWQPDSSPGIYYVAVYADCSLQSDAATYTLTAAVSTADDGTDIFLHSGVSKTVSVPAGGYKNFRFCLPAHTNNANADKGFQIIGGTDGVASNRLVVSAILGTVPTTLAGYSISGVGIVGPTKIVNCYAAITQTAVNYLDKHRTPISALTAPIDYDSRLICLLDSTQTIPGPLWYTVTSHTALGGYPYSITLSASNSKVPVPGMMLQGFANKKPQNDVTNPKSYFIIQSCTDPPTVCNLGYDTASTAGDTGTGGLFISGVFVDPASMPDYSNPPGMALMRGKKASNGNALTSLGDACADVIVTWSMTTADKLVKFPDVLLSRTTPTPTTEGYVWRRADYANYGMQRIPYSQLPARDANGFLSGSWFLSLYGYCGFSQSGNRGQTQLPGNDDDDYTAGAGPCYSNDAPATVTVSVSFIPRTKADCDVAPSTPVYAQYTDLTSGVPKTDEVAITKPVSSKWYRIKNPNPCNSMKVLLETKSAKDSNVNIVSTAQALHHVSAEIAIGKWPNVQPDAGEKSWTGYSSFNQNFTIDAWDPAFDGGKTCGANADEDCYYYINVFGYGSQYNYLAVGYTLTVTLVEQHRIYDVPQLAQLATPGAAKTYKFCVNPDKTPNLDATIDLFSYSDACACPNSYSNLELAVSKRLSTAGINDNVWRVGHGVKPKDGRTTLNLLKTDPDTRPGTYYLNVIGYCSSANSCQNECHCAPCSNLPSSPYSLSVRNLGAALSNPQPMASCSAYENYAAYGQRQCCVDTVAQIAAVNKDLSKASMTANAAVSMVALTWGAGLVALVYYAYRRCLAPKGSPEEKASLTGPQGSAWSEADVELSPASVTKNSSGHGPKSDHGRLSAHGSAHAGVSSL